MVSTKRINVVINNKVYTLVKEGNKYFFCDNRVANETLEQLISQDPDIEEYNNSKNRGQNDETACFVANLSNIMYLTDAPCTTQQIEFLWRFFCDIAALLYNNSPLIKNYMDFILQDGLFKYKNNSVPMNTDNQEDMTYIYELLA